jgi:hypothetical protein
MLDVFNVGLEALVQIFNGSDLGLVVMGLLNPAHTHFKLTVSSLNVA